MAISNNKQTSETKTNKKIQNENGKEEVKPSTDNSQSNDLKSVDNGPGSSINFGSNFIMLPNNNQVKELQTVIRDKYVSDVCFVLFVCHF